MGGNDSLAISIVNAGWHIAQGMQAHSRILRPRAPDAPIYWHREGSGRWVYGGFTRGRFAHVHQRRATRKHKGYWEVAMRADPVSVRFKTLREAKQFVEASTGLVEGI